MLHRPACSAAFGSFISFIPFSLHLPWCHFCSPELARLPRVSLQKWVCIIYQGIFQLLSNLPHLVILFFRLFVSCLFPPLHLSSTQGFPLLLREVCFPNHFPAPHPLPLSFTPSLSSPPRFRLHGYVLSRASFAGFEPLCLSPSEDLGTLFPPNSPIGSARRQHCCSVFVSSLAPHVAAPAAQLSRSRATTAGSGVSSVWRNVGAADLIKWLEDSIPVWMQHSQILLITEPEMLIPLSYKLLPHHQG